MGNLPLELTKVNEVTKIRPINEKGYRPMKFIEEKPKILDIKTNYSADDYIFMMNKLKSQKKLRIDQIQHFNSQPTSFANTVLKYECQRFEENNPWWGEDEAQLTERYTIEKNY